MRSIRIGAGSAASIDPISAGLEVLKAGMDYLVLEHLSEHSIARAQRRKRANGQGYAGFFEERMRKFLPVAAAHGTDIVTNAGAADPLAAGEVAVSAGAETGTDVVVTVVTGDDCVDLVRDDLETELEGTHRELVSANAYLGARQLIGALERETGESNVHLVITGRVADPSLTVAPLAHEFDWDFDDADTIGQATVLGHLLECSAQTTGGYFAEPGPKPVPDPHHLGFPFLEVEPDGTAVLSKPDGTGGRVDDQVVREQLYYEVHDPTAYVTPDVTANFTTVQLEQLGPDLMEIAGGTGSAAPDELKVTAGFADGYYCQCFIPYGGPNAKARADIAAEIVRDRLTEIHGLDLDNEVEVRTDYVGMDSLYGSESGADPSTVEELLLRVAGSAPTRDQVELVFREALQLWHLGPAGSGGVYPYEVDEAVNETIALESLLVPRTEIAPRVEYTGFSELEA
jgi:hypothetical protein